MARVWGQREISRTLRDKLGKYSGIAENEEKYWILFGKKVDIIGTKNVGIFGNNVGDFGEGRYGIRSVKKWPKNNEKLHQKFPPLPNSIYPQKQTQKSISSQYSRSFPPLSTHLSSTLFPHLSPNLSPHFIPLQNGSAGRAFSSEVYPEGSYTAYLLDRCIDQGSMLSLGEDGFNPSLPVSCVIELMQILMTNLGVSWAVSIGAVSSLVRVLLLPVAISVERQKRKLAAIQPHVGLMHQKVKQASARGKPDELAKAQKEYMNFRKKYGIALIPKSTIYTIAFQIPIFAAVYSAIASVSRNPEFFRDFAMEAPLWSESLCLPDPFLGGPFVCLAVFLTNYQCSHHLHEILKQKARLNLQQNDLSVVESSLWEKHSIWIVRFLGIFVLALSQGQPAGLFIYLFTGLSFQFALSLFCRISKVESLLDLPSLSAGLVTAPGGVGALIRTQSDDVVLKNARTIRLDVGLVNRGGAYKRSVRSMQKCSTNMDTASKKMDKSSTNMENSSKNMEKSVKNIMKKLNNIMERLKKPVIWVQKFFLQKLEKRHLDQLEKTAPFVQGTTAEKSAQIFLENKFRAERLSDDHVQLLKAQTLFMREVDQEKFEKDPKYSKKIRQQFIQLTTSPVTPTLHPQFSQFGEHNSEHLNAENTIRAINREDQISSTPLNSMQCNKNSSKYTLKKKNFNY